MKSQSLLDPSPTITDKETELYQRILIALDSSDHANAGMDISVAMACLIEESLITGVHVYAAKLHDVRFRQMEGGLPEQFREEQELERQRDVHDDLITRGLSIITDSYLDQAERNCQQADISFKRCSLEGKNYRALTEETNSGSYDLLVMGALGLGAVEGSRLGTVCQRVTRRSAIDTLVIKQPKRALTEGPIVVAVDGSAMAYGGLITALQLGQHWQVPVKVIAVFDPYFHYVAFNRIAGVLSEEAGKVFRFQEQEQLHEEIIDSGLAKIYQGHLDVAQSIAREHDVEIDTVLLDGKPHHAIAKFIKQVNASLLIIGKLGIHADDELDIGGNAENLLHDVDCAVLLSQRQHRPRLEVVADTTTSWTHEAEQAMDKVPDFARNMARMAILRHAQERGHTVITASIVDEATAQLCPSHARQAIEEIVSAHEAGEITTGVDKASGFKKLPWASDADVLLQSITNSSVRENLSNRAEKKARAENSATVEKKHLQNFIETEPDEINQTLHWQAAALARLMRVPEGFMRDTCRQHIEDYAIQQNDTDITLELAEAGLKKSRQAMAAQMHPASAALVDPSASEQGAQLSSGKCPFAAPDESVTSADNNKSGIRWSSEALARLEQIPAGMSRDMTCKAAEAIARNQSIGYIKPSFLDKVLETFQSGSIKVTETLPWEPAARQAIQRAPDMVCGMLIKEIEGWTRRQGQKQVTEAAVQTIKAEWQQKGYFHLAPDDPRSGKA